MRLTRRRFIQLGLLQITINQTTGCDNNGSSNEYLIESDIPVAEPTIQLTALTIDDTKTTIDSLSLYIGQ